MKKNTVLLWICILVYCFSGCGWSDEPISTTRHLPDSTSSVHTEPTDETISPEDNRDEPEIVRQEIATMLRDAEELIAEGLFDDAKMVLRDLRSRELTAVEKKKVNDLLAKLVTISD